MKRISIILSIVFSFSFSFSQPITNRSSAAITVQDGNLFALNSFRPAVYADTSAANAVTSLDSCGKQIFAYADNSYWLRACSPKRWIKILKTGDGISAANSGLSISGTTARLGQDSGAVGNPAALLRKTEIPMSDSFLYWRNGVLIINADHRPDTYHPPFRVIVNTPGSFMETAEFRSNYVAEVHIKSDSVKGYAGLRFSVKDTGVLGIGADRNANHAYLQIHNGNPLWIENSTSSVMAAFEEDGDCGIALNGAGRKLGIGVNVPQYKVDINSPLTGQTASNRLMNVYDSGSTYNTTSGALVNDLARFTSNATRSAGSNNLTNVAGRFNAFGGQVNRAIQIDSGTFLFGQTFDELSWAKILKLDTANNGAATQRRVAFSATKFTAYNDTAAGLTVGESGIEANIQYKVKGSVTFGDNLNASGLKAAMFLQRHTGYVGAHNYQGATAAYNNVATIPGGLTAGLFLSQSQTSGHTLTASGWWAAITSGLYMNTGNRIHNFVWLHAGGGQNGGTVDTGYALYIQPLLPVVGVRYAIMQVGTADTNSFAGITRHVNLTTGASTDSILVANNGILKRVLRSSVQPIANSFSQAVVAATTLTVTIGTTQANTTYKVNVTPTNVLSAALFYVSNKTTTTFDVVYLAGLTGTVAFDWALFQ